MATVSTQPLTATEFAKLQIDAPVELVAGEVIEMSVRGMRHAVVGNNCQFLLTTWNRSQGSQWYVGSEAGVITESNPDTVRGPDVVAISRERLPESGLPVGFLSITPELCVEILSPHDRWKDVLAKVHEYLNAGVAEIWLVDPAEQIVYLYGPDDAPQTLARGDTMGSKCLVDFRCRVSELFQDLPAASEQ